MGDDLLTVADEFNLYVDVKGTSPIEKIELYDGLKLYETIIPYNVNSITNRIRITCAGQNYRGRGRLVNWDCKAVFTKGKIKKFKCFNFWNPNRQPNNVNNNTLEWKTVTTGGSSGIDSWVTQDSLEGELIIKSNFEDIKINLSEINHKPKNYKFGGMDIRMSIQTLPEKLEKKDISKNFYIKLKNLQDYRFYVKAIQEDGHQAWSSPIYIKKQKVSTQA